MNKMSMKTPSKQMVNTKEKANLKPLLKLLPFCKPHLIWIILAIVFAFVSAICSLIGPNKISDIATEISKGLYGGDIALGVITEIAIFLVVLYALGHY